MKHLALLILLTTIGDIATAQQRGRSMLRIRLSDQSDIAVEVDGRYFDKGTTSLTLDGLRPGRHHLDVYSTSGTGRAMRIYSGTIRLEPETVHTGVVDVNRRMMRLYAGAMDGNSRIARPGRSDAMPADNVTPSDGQAKPPPAGSIAQSGTGAQSAAAGSFPKGKKKGGGPSVPTMTASGMKALKSEVGKRVADTEKERLLHTNLDGQKVSTVQVREIMRWLAFESTRIDFARWVYPRVTDPQNYSNLASAFTLEESKKELAEIIRQ